MNPTTTTLPAELQLALILTLITSVVAPMILLFLNRIVNHKGNDVDMAKKALETAGEAVGQLSEAREALRQSDVQHEREMDSLNAEIAKLKAAVTGKYRVTLEFMTGTNPSIVSTNIILVPETSEAVPTVVNPADED